MKLFKQHIKLALKRIVGKPANRISHRVLNEADVISFDVFDTLVCRTCGSPENVFKLVDRRCRENIELASVGNFENLRKKAECAARMKKGSIEITLDDIYSQINLPERQKVLLKEIELATEFAVCYANSEMKSLYESLIQSGKRVILVSDMYIPYYAVEMILDFCGYVGYERLYVSSKYGARKRDGTLFNKVFKEMKVAPSELVHIGDSLASDYSVPKRLGAKSILYKREWSRHFLYSQKRLESIQKAQMHSELEIDTFKEILQMGEAIDVSGSERFGFEVLGPMLYGYSTWLHSIIVKEQPDEVWFLAREGALLKQAYELLYGDAGVPQRYLNVSRIALCRAVAALAKDERELATVFYSMRRVMNTCRDCLDVLGLEYTDEELLKDGLSSDLPLMNDDDYMSIYRWAYSHNRLSFQRQYLLLRKYLGLDENEKKTIVICDIGGSGTMQMMLHNMLPQATIIGAYIGVTNGFLEDDGRLMKWSMLDRRGYWFGADEYETKGKPFRFTLSALEAMLLNNEGTTLKFISDRDDVLPVKDTIELASKTKSAVVDLHNGAKQFLSNCRACRISEWLDRVDPNVAFVPYINTVVYPARDAMDYFEKIVYADGTKHITLVPNRNLWFYVLHPRTLSKDFSSSISKSIWLQGLLYLPLPYYKFLVYLSNRGIRTKATNMLRQKT